MSIERENQPESIANPVLDRLKELGIPGVDSLGDAASMVVVYEDGERMKFPSPKRLETIQKKWLEKKAQKEADRKKLQELIGSPESNQPDYTSNLPDEMTTWGWIIFSKEIVSVEPKD